ncbi:unnamed protein product [Chironomus riparius]|uniref:Sm domain-containing protein n=1 Tax=Chironomus riparius TaxID=315576 RepID=A0A9N9RN32_9DIPT|nr:unnamed protein product [Chironomus riparius]
MNSEPKQSENSEKCQEKDDELDITSEHFNPLKALYSNEMKLPVKNVKRLDNLAVFLSRLKNAENKIDSELTKQPTTSKKAVPKTETDEDEKYHITKAGRKFLKEQAPVHRGKKAKFKRDLIVRMENSKGPLALLHKFVSNKRKVKVYVRKEHGIRGYIIGQLAFFDKHYNLALIDCTETWKRRKFKFSDSNISFPNPPQDCSKFLALMGIEVPQIKVKSLNRKYVECTRKLNQIMIRGEDVILISEFTEDQKVS